MSEQTNWRTVQFLLENTVFLLIGLQLPDIVSRRLGQRGGRSPGSCSSASVVLVATIVARVVWVFAATALYRFGPPPLRRPCLAWAHATLVSWAGMRGVVTLAAAFLLPQDDAAARHPRAGRGRRRRRHAPGARNHACPAGAPPRSPRARTRPRTTSRRRRCCPAGGARRTRAARGASSQDDDPDVIALLRRGRSNAPTRRGNDSATAAGRARRRARPTAGCD